MCGARAACGCRPDRQIDTPRASAAFFYDRGPDPGRRVRPAMPAGRPVAPGAGPRACAHCARQPRPTRQLRRTRGRTALAPGWCARPSAWRRRRPIPGTGAAPFARWCVPTCLAGCRRDAVAPLRPAASSFAGTWAAPSVGQSAAVPAPRIAGPAPPHRGGCRRASRATGRRRRRATSCRGQDHDRARPAADARRSCRRPGWRNAGAGCLPARH